MAWKNIVKCICRANSNSYDAYNTVLKSDLLTVAAHQPSKITNKSVTDKLLGDKGFGKCFQFVYLHWECAL